MQLCVVCNEANVEHKLINIAFKDKCIDCIKQAELAEKQRKQAEVDYWTRKLQGGSI